MLCGSAVARGGSEPGPTEAAGHTGRLCWDGPGEGVGKTGATNPVPLREPELGDQP